MRDDRAFVEDMLHNIALIEKFTVDGEDVFLESDLIQQAVIRCLEVIGEASRNITEETRAKHPEIEWREIGRFRNFVAHVYWAIKMERIWPIVEDDLPPLKHHLENVLVAMPRQDD